MSRRGALTTAGERVFIETEPAWVSRLIDECAGPELRPDELLPTANILVERNRRRFEANGWFQLTRGAWSGDRALMMRNVCASGFDLLLRWRTDRPHFGFRWRPPLRERAASSIMRARARLLARAALVHYPALWMASTRGRVPLHVSACVVGDESVVLAGASGMGKSTLISRELSAGARIVSDNLCVSDGTTVWGVVEPLRIEGGTGRRMPHGRREAAGADRLASLVPDRLLVLRRGQGSELVVRECEPEAAVRALIASTYIAGELRRYWGFAATLATATGWGPIHPSIEGVARALASSVPCVEAVLPRLAGVRLGDLLSESQRASA